MPKITNGNLLSSAEYDQPSKTLTLTFARGGVYSYADVPPHIYTGILTAISPGTFFHKSIKPQFVATKQESGPKQESET